WLEIWDRHYVLVTYDKVYFYANDDNLSFWVEDEESIIKKKAKGQQLWLVTFFIIKPGQQADGYWKSEHMVNNFVRKQYQFLMHSTPGA
ncbi:32013_t:CDS:2, partial [Gigaspora margarita]